MRDRHAQSAQVPVQIFSLWMNDGLSRDTCKNRT
jgi:hypothetical protein